MSSIENPSMYVRNVVKKLPAALIVALLTLIGLGGTSVFAQESIISVEKPEITTVQGGVVPLTIQVFNNTGIAPEPGPARPLQITSITDAACQSGPTLKTGEDANNNGFLDPAESPWEYSCTINAGTQSFNNFVEVRGFDGAAPIADSDAGSVTVLNFGIHVTKSPAATPINQGDDAVFNITIQNTGLANINAATASNLVISDPLCAGGPIRGADVPPGDGDNLLEFDPDGSVTDGDVMGEIWTYTCTVPNAVTDKVTNSVVVTAKDVTGATYSHNATAVIEVLNPGLNLTKAPNKPTVIVNEVVTWTFTVYNTGETNLTPAGTPIVDNNCPAPAVANQVDTTIRFIDGDTNSNNVLNPGEIWIYECARRYSGAGIKLNTATANFGLTDSASSQVEVIVPGIAIEKTPFVQFVPKGGNATFAVNVTNTGQGNLSNVVVEDLICSNAVNGKLALVSGDTNSDGKLNPDNLATPQNEAEVWLYTCIVNNVQTDDTNVATVTAKDISGNTLAATATANIKMVNPGINIVKSIFTTNNGDTAVLQGEDVTFNLRVTNAGNAELSNVTVVDPQCNVGVTGPQAGNDADNDGRLDPGEIWDFRCTKEDVISDFTNVATVTALQTNINQSVSDDDTLNVDVLTPGLQLEKTPAFQVIQEGQVYTWTLKINNTGQANLFPAPGLIDPLCVGGPNRENDVPPGNNDAILNPGETWVYTCDGPLILTFTQDEIINTAVAQFVDGNSNTVSDVERATVQVVRNIIDVEKTANPSVIVSGGSVNFNFQVRNFSGQDLSNVAVTDTQCPGGTATFQGGDTNNDAKLNMSEVWNFVCTVSGKTANFTNIATVSAKQPNNNTVTDTDTATVQVLNAKIDVEKSTSTPNVQQGGDASFTIEVKNTGTLQLQNVVPVDDKCTLSTPTGDGNLNGRLDPNETWTYTCTVSNVQNSFVNNVTVTAKEVGSNLGVSDSASVGVTVIRPSINLIKTANQSTVQQGGTAYFTIVINNSGSVNLTNVVPTDAFCPLVVVSNGNGNTTLEVSETWVYSCAVPNVQSATGTFVNTASVTANGGAVSASDDASVTVINTPPPGNPGIDVEKTPDSQVVAKNSNVTFGISVSNSGDVALNPVSVTDPLCTLVPVSLGNGNATLDVGETWTYTCTVNKVKANLTNTASASGTSAAGQTVSDSDSATVTIAGTKIKLEKSPKTQTIVKGSNATFLVTLNNPTAENLTNVVLSDPQCTTLTRQADAPGNNDAVLNSGETWRWSCTITNVQKSFTNKAKVTVIRPSGKKLTANASAKIIVKTSSQIRVTTSPEDVTALRGSNVPLSILVTNIGKGNLVNVTVSHSACAAAPTLVNKGNGDDKLASGETWTFACTVSNIQSEVSAAAVATATDEATGTVEEADALLDIEIFNEADEEADEATDEAVEAPAFKIFTPLITR